MDVTDRQPQTAPALDGLVRTGNTAVILTARILALAEDSGASQVEILSALGAVRELVLSFPISLVTSEGGESSAPAAQS